MKLRQTNNGKKGGLLKGKPHYDSEGNSVGGIKAVVTDSNKPVELEGGEVIINKHASKKYWRELSKINQSAGNGVPIGNPNNGDDEDPEEYKEGGRVIEFTPNHLPNKRILLYAKKIKSQYPKVWDKGGNIFGNEAFNNLKRVSERGYWLESEKWMYIKWRSYVARHKQDFRINGVVAMLKWVDKVDKGWEYMKNLIELEIEKKYPSKMAKGGNISWQDYKNSQFNEDEDRYLPSDYLGEFEIKNNTKQNYPILIDKINGLEYRKKTNSLILGVFDGDKQVADADNKVVQVAKQYQKRGIGVELIDIIKKQNPNHRFGSMTPEGFNLMGSYYDKKIANKKSHNMAKGGQVITYKNKFNKKYGFDSDESHNLKDIAKITGLKQSSLQDIYDKGIGAYKTNPDSVRPNVKSKEQWAMARVYSAVMGGKAAKVDANELSEAKMEQGGTFYTRTYKDGTSQKFSVEDYENNIYPYLENNGVDDSKGLYIIIEGVNDENKFKGSYKKIFDIIEQSTTLYNPYGVEIEKLIGDKFHVYITPKPENDIIEKISNLKNVEVVVKGNTKYANGGLTNITFDSNNKDIKFEEGGLLSLNYHKTNETKMNNGGIVYDFKIGDKGRYETRSGFIDIEITNITDKGWVIFKDDKGNRKDAKVDVFNNKFTKTNQTQTQPQNTPTPTTKPSNQILELGKIYNIDDYQIDDNTILFDLKKSSNKQFKVFEVANDAYNVERPNYNGNAFWVVDFDKIRIKPNSSNQILKEGEVYNIDDYEFDDNAVLGDLKGNKNKNKQFKVFNVENGYYDVENPDYKFDLFWKVNFDGIRLKKQTQTTQPQNNVSSNSIIGIGVKGKYQTRQGLIDIEITNITDKGWVIFKDDKGNRKDAKVDVFAEKFTSSTQLFNIPTNVEQPIEVIEEKVEPVIKKAVKIEPKKVETEEINFDTLKSNFIQKNIIGENTIFTPKFVVLESLIELNELTKVKEKEFSDELESIINNIDNFKL